MADASSTSSGGHSIGTHNGAFHCDEVLACVMLRHTAQFSDCPIVRTRDPEVLAGCTIVVDVGGVYEPQNLRFDHHQRGFTEVFGNGFNTKLSSAGLVYKHFGQEVLSTITGLGQESPQLQTIYKKIYDVFIESVDAIDNGVEVTPEGVKPNYKVRTDLASRVKRCNPSWTEENPNYDDYFAKAMEIAQEELFSIVKGLANDWLPAKDIVVRTIENRFAVDPSGEILKLERFCPWVEHLHATEKEMNIVGLIKFVLYEDRNGSWRVQGVNPEGQTFGLRVGLREPWRGVRDEELSKLSGIEGAIFVHAAGFIGGAKTYEGALQLAQITLKHVAAAS
eukprot:CAMPEP_0115010472 /NCGR_PEP_ID=MMETSP0216-20121206/23340_1 /TAXON_ID=223996 /ORGANISM="Protocruzia adherens, Strain Boccale" /LENGTH=335 /DNA_ID=CAMNT_0002378701 /DNA_START=12 /DNA_END=1015 /DNA_ORIENTATION=+